VLVRTNDIGLECLYIKETDFSKNQKKNQKQLRKWYSYCWDLEVQSACSGFKSWANKAAKRLIRKNVERTVLVEQYASIDAEAGATPF
jgi:hypothetical protein